MAWLLLCIAFGLNVSDEAAHGFLSYYNATVLTLYGHFSWFPRMDLEFRGWLIGLVVAVAVCTGLTPFALRNVKWLRPLGYFYAGVQFLNGMMLVWAQIYGGTVPSVRFEGVAPGFYTSPLSLAGSVYLFWSLHRSAKAGILPVRENSKP